MTINARSFVGFCVLLVCSVAPPITFQEDDKEGAPEELSMFLYVEEDDAAAIKHTLWGPLIVDFSAVKIERRKFDELDKMTGNEEGLLTLLTRFENGPECVGVAVFLNQKYPDKLFNPIALPFSAKYRNKIPLGLSRGEKMEIVHVYPETFGQICYAYWSRQLGVGEFKLFVPPDAKE